MVVVSPFGVFTAMAKCQAVTGGSAASCVVLLWVIYPLPYAFLHRDSSTMTTPARNVSQALSAAGQHCFQQLKPTLQPRSCSAISGVYKQYDDVRPQSGNSLISDGFRLCRAWSHSGGNVMQNGASCSYTAFYNNGAVVHRDISNGFWTMDIPWPIDPSGNMINATVVKALNNLKQQDLHLGNFLAEGNKTVAMLAHTASFIARDVIGFRRKNPKLWEQVRAIQRGGLRRSDWCLIPSKWLELQYGWIPFLSDLYGGMQHLQKRSRFELPYVKGSARSPTNKVTHPEKGADWSIGDLWRASVIWESEQKVWVNLFYKITNPQLAELSSLGLINPVEIVWELLPYSFVIDWLVPVSSWLSALTADVGMTFVTGSMSRKSECKYKSATFYATPGNVQRIEGAGPGVPVFTGSRRVFNRTCYASSPVPGLYVKSPISLKHALNSLALLIQAFR